MASTPNQDDDADGPDHPGRRWHDMGGVFDRGAPPAIARGEHDFALWEKRIDALMVLCSAKGLFTVDGLRRALEDLGPDAFERMSYYERWVAAVTQNLIESETITIEALRERMAEVAARGETYGEASLASPPSSSPTPDGEAGPS